MCIVSVLKRMGISADLLPVIRCRDPEIRAYLDTPVSEIPDVALLQPGASCTLQELLLRYVKSGAYTDMFICYDDQEIPVGFFGYTRQGETVFDIALISFSLGRRPLFYDAKAAIGKLHDDGVVISWHGVDGTKAKRFYDSFIAEWGGVSEKAGDGVDYHIPIRSCLAFLGGLPVMRGGGLPLLGYQDSARAFSGAGSQFSGVIDTARYSPAAMLASGVFRGPFQWLRAGDLSVETSNPVCAAEDILSAVCLFSSVMEGSAANFSEYAGGMGDSSTVSGSSDPGGVREASASSSLVSSLLRFGENPIRMGFPGPFDGGSVAQGGDVGVPGLSDRGGILCSGQGSGSLASARFYREPSEAAKDQGWGRTKPKLTDILDVWADQDAAKLEEVIRGFRGKVEDGEMSLEEVAWNTRIPYDDLRRVFNERGLPVAKYRGIVSGKTVFSSVCSLEDDYNGYEIQGAAYDGNPVNPSYSKFTKKAGGVETSAHGVTTYHLPGEGGIRPLGSSGPADEAPEKGGSPVIVIRPASLFPVFENGDYALEYLSDYQDNAEEAGFIGSSSKSGLSGFWVSPKGKIYILAGEEHGEYALAHPEIFGPSGRYTSEQFISALVSKGWATVRVYSGEAWIRCKDYSSSNLMDAAIKLEDSYGFSKSSTVHLDFGGSNHTESASLRDILSSAKPFSGSYILSSYGDGRERAGVVVLGPDGRILGCHPTGESSGKYDLPKGHLDKGEQPIDCAIRELAEETSLTVSPSDLSFLGRTAFGRGYITLYLYMPDELPELTSLSCPSLIQDSGSHPERNGLPEMDGYQYIGPTSGPDIGQFYNGVYKAMKAVGVWGRHPSSYRSNAEEVPQAPPPPPDSEEVTLRSSFRAERGLPVLITSATIQDLMNELDEDFIHRGEHLDATAAVNPGGPEIVRVFGSTVEFKTKSEDYASNGTTYKQFVMLKDFNLIAKDKDISIEEAIEYSIDYGDVHVYCTDPSFKFWGAHYMATQLDYNFGPNREHRFPGVRNPQLRDSVCKHLHLVFRKLLNSKGRLVELFSQYYKKLPEVPQDTLVSIPNAPGSKQEEFDFETIMTGEEAPVTPAEALEPEPMSSTAEDGSTFVNEDMPEEGDEADVEVAEANPPGASLSQDELEDLATDIKSVDTEPGKTYRQGEFRFDEEPDTMPGQARAKNYRQGELFNRYRPSGPALPKAVYL